MVFFLFVFDDRGSVCVREREREIFLNDLYNDFERRKYLIVRGSI